MTQHEGRVEQRVGNEWLCWERRNNVTTQRSGNSTVCTRHSAESIISNLDFHIIFRCSPSRVLCELPDIPLAVQHHLTAATPRAAFTRFNVETSGFYSILRVNLTEKIFSWHNQSKIKLNSLHSEPTLQKTFFFTFYQYEKGSDLFCESLEKTCSWIKLFCCN